MIISIVLGLVIGILVFAAADIGWLLGLVRGAVSLTSDYLSLIMRRLYDWRCDVRSGANVIISTMALCEKRYQYMVMCTLMS